MRVYSNALKEHQIYPSTIGSYARTDMCGVISLVQAVNQGYAYVKQ